MIDLHTNVYPRNFRVEGESIAGQRPREGHGESSHVPEELVKDVGSRRASSETRENGGSRLDACLSAFDEELRRFARTRADGDVDASSSAGREFVFADFVKDKRVLNAARMMCGSASGASASGQGIMLDQATSSTTSMAQEDESFRLRTAVTHGILRLRKKGWLVLADEQRDAYLYVSCPSPHLVGRSARGGALAPEPPRTTRSTPECIRKVSLFLFTHPGTESTESTECPDVCPDAWKKKKEFSPYRLWLIASGARRPRG